MVEVYPGLHTVYFVYRHTGLCLAGNSSCAMQLTRHGRLTFEVEPGRIYRIAANYRNGSLSAWAVDEYDDTIVASSEPNVGDWAARSQSFGFGYVTQF